MDSNLSEESIKYTQEILGKHIKKPQLTEKLLRKPPFRFLHDIVTAVLKNTGFFDGLFDETELQSENCKDREAKIGFLSKVITVVSLVIEKPLNVRPPKVVAGQEPEKTNELLQCIGIALDRNLSSNEAVQQVKNKDVNIKDKSHAKEEAKPKAKKAEEKNKASDKVRNKPLDRDLSVDRDKKIKDIRKDVDKKHRDRSTSKTREKVNQNTAKTDKANRDGSESKKDKDSKDKPKRDHTKKVNPALPTGAKSDIQNKRKSPPKSDNIKNIIKQISNDEPYTIPLNNDKAEDLSLFENIEVQFVEPLIPTENSIDQDVGDNELKVNYLNGDQSKVTYVDGDADQSNIDHLLEASELKKPNILYETVIHASEENFDLSSKTHNDDHHQEKESTSDKSIKKQEHIPNDKEESNKSANVSKRLRENQTKDLEQNTNENKLYQSPKKESRSQNSAFKKSKSLENNDSDLKSKVKSVDLKDDNVQKNLRPHSVRPPSARPGAPRLKDKKPDVLLNPSEPIALGKVNVILENFAPDDEDNDHSLVLLEQNGDSGDGQDVKQDIPAPQLGVDHGRLVNQILETRNEFNKLQTGKVEIEWELGALKQREARTQEVEALRAGLQAASRAAAPLARLLDHVPEDVELMRQELETWAARHRDASARLRKQRELAEDSLKPLLAKIKQLDLKIEDKKDQINNLKATNHKSKLRIDRLLAGNDVQY